LLSLQLNIDHQNNNTFEQVTVNAGCVLGIMKHDRDANVSVLSDTFGQSCSV